MLKQTTRKPAIFVIRSYYNLVAGNPNAPPGQPWELSLTSEPVERRLAVVLAADVAGYSRLMGADVNGLHIVDCEISGAALDDLARVRWTRKPLYRDIIFLEYRDLIERLAGNQFGALENTQQKIVRLFARHLPKRLRQRRKT